MLVKGDPLFAEHISQVVFADKDEPEDLKDDVRALYKIIARIEQRLTALEKRVEDIEWVSR